MEVPVGASADKVAEPIAIIGMSCRYPGAKDLNEFWECIVARRQQFRAFPNQRMPMDLYYDPDPTVPDKTYARRGCFIDDWDLDLRKFRVLKGQYATADITHWLSLDIATKALEDAGYDRSTSPELAQRTGVVLGNTLTGEFARSYNLRLRWPYVQRQLEQTAIIRGMDPATAADLIAEFKEEFNKNLPETTEDSLSGQLSNTIAGRICNYFDFGGGGYVVDGACASSLIAVCTGASALAARDMDMVVVGGVDISEDPFEVIGFAKTKALSADIMRVYDNRGDGFIPGEGCGFVVMKRLSDAVRDGDRIYATLAGWGISSDGESALTAPKAAGQARALAKAYQRSGLLPRQVDFVEGHGTGTAVGDKIELTAVATIMDRDDTMTARHTGMTSLKSIMGHTKAAAGIGAFIKTAISVNRRVIPPVAGCDEPNSIFDTVGRSLYPIMRGQVVEHDITGGVSAMGFGGINTHCLLQSYTPTPPCTKFDLRIPERALLAANQEIELFAFSGTSAEHLINTMEAVQHLAPRIAFAELRDLALDCALKVDMSHEYRASCLATDPDRLAEALGKLMLASKTQDAFTHAFASPATDCFLGRLLPGHAAPRLSFLFPGQGSQKLGMARNMLDRHIWAQDVLSAFETESPGLTDVLYPSPDILIDQEETHAARLSRTTNAQPAIAAASVIWLQKLKELGITPTNVAGHSLGELTAFFAAGRLDLPSLARLIRERSTLMDNASADSPGEMIALLCSLDQAKSILSRMEHIVEIANVNSPRQVVVACAKAATPILLATAAQRGIKAVKLAVSNGYHSSFMQEAADAFSTSSMILNSHDTSDTATLWSTTTSRPLRTPVDLHSHFGEHLRQPVDFVSLIEGMAEETDVFLELGPGRVLTGLVGNILGTRGTSMSIESQVNKHRDLLSVVASLWARGSPVQITKLFDDRAVRPFQSPDNKKFLTNPCERDQLTRSPSDNRSRTALENKVTPSVALAKPFSTQQPRRPTPSDVSVIGSLTAQVVELTGFPESVVAPSSRLLDDLNLDSIKANEYLANAFSLYHAEKTLVPSEYANATLQEIADAIESCVNGITSPSSQRPSRDSVGMDEHTILGKIRAALVDLTGFTDDFITPGSRLLADLNLDSIKATAFVSDIVQELGIPANEVVPAEFSDATLAELASALHTLMPKSPQLQSSRPMMAASDPASQRLEMRPDLHIRKGWVREFGLTWKPTERQGPHNANEWSGLRVLVVTTTSSASALAIMQPLMDVGATVDVRDWTDLSEPELQTGLDYVLALSQPRMNDANSGRTQVEMLAGLAVFLAKSKPKRFAYIEEQPQLSFRGSDCELILPGVASGQSFCKSLALERAQCKTRVVTVANFASQQFSAVLPDLLGDQAFHEVVFDQRSQRYEPLFECLDPSTYRARDITWTKEDVIVVTGGAKGITAQCAFALAQHTGVRMALIGSSAEDDEIRETLSRYSSVQLMARYYRCDLTCPEDVKKAVASATEELGLPTGLVHGAGRNSIRLAHSVSADDAIAEMGPKLMGAANLLHLLGRRPLKLLVALTSIFSLTGMAGNAWYSYANQNLFQMFMQHAAQYQVKHVACAAFSVWEEIGMGARMNALEGLRALGFSSLSPSEGVARFLRLCLRHCGNILQPVITSRVGSFATFPRHTMESESHRFVDFHDGHAGVELVSRTLITATRDPYVLEHRFNGSTLFATVFGLEAMAQVAMAVSGKPTTELLRIENISLEHPLVVHERTGLIIEICAVVREEHTQQPTVDCAIYSKTTGFTLPHFTATFVFATDMESLRQLSDHVPLSHRHATTDIIPQRDYYGGLLFQEGRFQAMGRVHHLSAEGVVFQNPSQGAASLVEFPVVLGDPFARDVLLQSGQVIVTDSVFLPVHIDTIEFGAGFQDAQDRLAHTSLISCDNTNVAFAVTSETGSGRFIERMTGYTCRKLHSITSAPSVADIMNPGDSDQRQIQSLLNDLSLDVRVQWQRDLRSLSRPQRHELESHMVQSAIETHDSALGHTTLAWDENNKPCLSLTRNGEQLGCSITHQDDYLLVAVSKDPVGIDLEAVEPRSATTWTTMLQPMGSELLGALLKNGNQLDRACTRIWTAMEAFFKFSGQRAQTMKMISSESDRNRVVFKTTGGGFECLVSTWPILLARGKHRILAVATSNMVGTPSMNIEPAFPAGLLSRYYADKTVFITGGTGFLGMTIAHKMVTDLKIKKLYVLVRSRAQRLEESWTAAMPAHAKALLRSGVVVPVVGDISTVNLGMDHVTLNRLCREVEVVINSAANIGLTVPLRHLILDNCIAALNLVQLATTRFERLDRIVHVSSAYVSTFQTNGRVCTEDIHLVTGSPSDPEEELRDVLAKQTSTLLPYFASPYAYSKYLAERLLQHRFPDAPLLIVRPSTIATAIEEPFAGFEVRASAPSSNFIQKVMEYDRQDLRIYSPQRGQVPFDEIPVDMVSSMLLAHAAVPNHNGIVHATVGHEQAGTWADLFEAINQTMPQSRRKNIIFVDSARAPNMWPPAKFYRVQEFDIPFDIARTRAIKARMCPADLAMFHVDVESVDWFAYGRRKMAEIWFDFTRVRPAVVPAVIPAVGDKSTPVPIRSASNSTDVHPVIMRSIPKTSAVGRSRQKSLQISVRALTDDDASVEVALQSSRSIISVIRRRLRSRRVIST